MCFLRAFEDYAAFIVLFFYFNFTLNNTGSPFLFVSSIPFISFYILHANMKAWSNKKLIFLTFIEALPTRLLFIFSLNIYERPIIGWIQSYFNVFPSLWMSDAFDEYTPSMEVFFFIPNTDKVVHQKQGEIVLILIL